jgi:hypothetical protein
MYDRTVLFGSPVLGYSGTDSKGKYFAIFFSGEILIFRKLKDGTAIG